MPVRRTVKKRARVRTAVMSNDFYISVIVS